MSSILITTKSLLGISEEDTSFDTEIIIHINSALMTLNDLGIGPREGFRISSDMETWENFLGDVIYLEDVKSYVYIKVRLLFDPPSNTGLGDALKKQADEYEWRLKTRSELWEEVVENGS